MLAMMGMSFPSADAQPVKCALSNIRTYIQADDEIIEIEGEESDLDFEDYIDEVPTTNKTKQKGTSKVDDIITYILLGIFLIAFLYGFYWLRHNNVTVENHPVIYTSLKVFKFSAIIGIIGWIAFLICEFGVKNATWSMVSIGATGFIIVLYAIYKSCKSYPHLESIVTKILVTIVSIVLGLAVGFSGLVLLCLYILWYVANDKLGFDKYTLSDGTEIKRINSFSSQYRDSDGNTYERTSDGDFVKI